jgi:hypothetical protein
MEIYNRDNKDNTDENIVINDTTLSEIDIDNLYSIFNVSEKKIKECKKSTTKCALLSISICVYILSLATFQCYILQR